MNLKSHACNRRQIVAFVNHQLEGQSLTEFEGHLDECESCRDELAALIADEQSWHKAGLYLRDDEADVQSLSHLSTPGAGTAPLQAQHVLDSLAPTDDPQFIGRLGEYEISGVIGCGGMGAVLKGFDRSLNRVVAIKILAPQLANSGAARQRFSREAQAAAAVTHDNVIDIYSVSETRGQPYLVMPYLRGMSLQSRIDGTGSLPLLEVLRIGRQVAAGLAAAHEQGLVHRDIKPANILLSGGVDRVLITDFGLARAVDDASVTKTGVIAGTPHYMSPEQARGEAVDHQSDLFSLGSVLYACCTGRPPFRAEGAYGLLRRITDSHPRPIREINPQIPEWLEAIIARLHAKSPDERFGSAHEVRNLLEQCLAHVQQPTKSPLPASCRSRGRMSQIGGLSIGTLKACAAGLLLVVTCAVVVGLLAVGGRPFPGQSSPSGTLPAHQTPPATTPAVPKVDPEPATSWDATASDIESFRDALTPLENRSRQLWDDSQTTY